jgi:hypothetical protein
MLKLALLALLLVGAGVLAGNSLYRPPPPAPLPLPTAHPSNVGLNAADEMTLELDEATLTAQLRSILGGKPLADTPLGPAAASDLVVQVGNGQITASGTAQAGAASLPVSLTFGVEAQAGRLVIAVREARVGGVTLPEAARQPIEQSVQSPVDQMLGQQHIKVHSATLGRGKLVLVASR